MGLAFFGALGIVAIGALGGGQTATAVAADQPAAAGSAQSADSGQAAGTQATPSKEKKSTGKKTKGGKSAKPRGRLPNYFSGVVTDEQREKIYAIQNEFEPKIKELILKLDSLKKERDEKINALLTPEQKKKIDDLKAAAKQAREKKESTGSKEKEGGAKATSTAPKPQAAK